MAELAQLAERRFVVPKVVGSNPTFRPNLPNKKSILRFAPWPVALLILLAHTAFAQPDSEVHGVGPGVTPPVLIHKEEPKYSNAAFAARIQGNVLLQLVVSAAGVPTQITVLSPLGYGLDDLAVDAVNRWRFKPAMKEGQSVSILATVQVNFRLTNLNFDSRDEQRRTDFNFALRNLNTSESTRTAAIAKMQKLAHDDYPAAMWMYAIWLQDGKVIPQDAGRGGQLMLKAAARNYGPAIFEVGKMYLEGRGVPVDTEKGMQMIRDSSVLGSRQAQYFLGDAYEKGQGVEQDLDRARRSFRLCAAGGQTACQYRLAVLMLQESDRRERDTIQALAWLELAAAKGLTPAATLLAQERPKLTAAQVQWMETLKVQLLQPVQ